jgi:hypothetical protein
VERLRNARPRQAVYLRRVATIESIGSSTWIEGSKLSDCEADRLLTNLQIKDFTGRDEQKVADYAKVMELIFSPWKEITFTDILVVRYNKTVTH